MSWEYLGNVVPGEQVTVLAQSKRLKPGEDHMSFREKDAAKRWVEGYARGDSFMELDWVDVQSDRGWVVTVLTGREMSDEEIDSSNGYSNEPANESTVHA